MYLYLKIKYKPHRRKYYIFNISPTHRYKTAKNETKMAETLKAKHTKTETKHNVIFLEIIILFSPEI